MFAYPLHFKHPEDKRIFFIEHIGYWEYFLSEFKNKPNIVLEIGALYGGSSVYILESFCKKEGSQMYIMDINDNEYLENNIKPYNNVKLLLGESADSFKLLNKEYFDIIYIDGNHMSKYVLEDAVNSFYSLKKGGIMIFDDYGGGWEQPKHMQVKTAVTSFIDSYEKHIKIIHTGYQIFIQKLYYYNIDEMKENYYN